MTRLPAEMVNFPVLVGDIGGTNARFALLSDPQAEPIIFPVAQTADFASLEEAVQATILDQTSLRPVSAILAVAGLVEGDEIRLTNCPWVVRPSTFFVELGFSEMIVLNDFEAQALAVVALGSEHLEQIGGEAGDAQASRVVLGPGTGLGVAGLVHAGSRWIPVPGEGGHMDLGPRTQRDYAIWPHLETIGGRISGEQLLCGRGLVNIYRAIAAAENAAPVLTDPAQITASALAKTDPLAVETLDLFVTCLGRTAGDLALVFKSKGGVFLAGGIAQKILPALKNGAFRAAFDDKAPHRHLLEAMPVFVVTHPLAALAGLAAFARAPARFSLDLHGRHWTA